MDKCGNCGSTIGIDDECYLMNANNMETVWVECRACHARRAEMSSDQLKQELASEATRRVQKRKLAFYMQRIATLRAQITAQIRQRDRALLGKQRSTTVWITGRVTEQDLRRLRNMFRRISHSDSPQ